MLETIILLVGGFLAGAMNALAGGGSFISLPALIAVGVPPVIANTSSTVALYPGSMASAWAYRHGLAGVADVPIKPLLLITIFGGVVGALLLLYTPTRAFDLVLPWLLLIATIALAYGRRIGSWLRARVQVRTGVVMILQFVLGIYGGYFGGAVGIMMVAVWGLLGPYEIKSMNPARTLMVTAANTMAVVIFIWAGAIQWHATVLMLLSATIGGYAGALLGIRLPARIIRFGTILLTACITAVFFVRAYG